AQAEARLLASWPAGQPLPQNDQLLVFQSGQTPSLNGQMLPRLSDAQGWVGYDYMP
ncbi:hypothetical protein PF70_06545, partial [Pseudomonas asplenii]